VFIKKQLLEGETESRLSDFSVRKEIPTENEGLIESPYKSPMLAWETLSPQ